MSGNRYGNPTGQEMHDFLQAIGFERDSPSAWGPTKERTYSRHITGDLHIVVFTTISHNGITRRRGSDAIRATVFSEDYGFIRGSRRVNRTYNWRLNLLKRIETLEDAL